MCCCLFIWLCGFSGQQNSDRTTCGTRSTEFNAFYATIKLIKLLFMWKKCKWSLINVRQRNERLHVRVRVLCLCVCVLLRLNKAIDSVNAHIDVTQAAALVLTHDVWYYLCSLKFGSRKKSIKFKLIRAATATERGGKRGEKWIRLTD